MAMPQTKGQHPVAGLISEDDQAHRCGGSGDQDEDHHVVDFPKDLIDMLRNVEGVVDRACGVEQDHADDEDAPGPLGAWFRGRMRP